MRICKPFVFCFLSSAIMLTSCQKEISADFLQPPAAVNPLLGNWKFIHVHGNSTSSVEINQDDNDVVTNTVADYLSENNQGTYSFSDSTVTASGIAYDFNTEAHSITYLNGNLADSSVYPFIFSLPQTSGTTTYHLLGQDSMTTGAALIPQVAGAPTNTPTDPLGYHFIVTGDTLVVSAEVDQSVTDNSQGVPIVSNTRVTVISTLAKQ